ncbi:MAG: hypothetical protein PHQ80_00390 [Candidatus ainarchaeum sp.]|nr:hypothetical protein [Candidatus ainarchaeum sp.]MDD5096257.1 hypothetical protein [Candidatus ainarchaeum sp.]
MKILGKEVGNADFVFALVLIASLVMQNDYLGQLQQLPSPLYGGDYYNGLGGVNHIASGGNVLDSAQMAGEAPWVPWLYHLSIAGFSWASGLDTEHALIYFSLVVQVLSLIVAYVFVGKVSGNRYAGIIAAILFLRDFPIFKYSDFANVLTVPAFALGLYLFMEKRDLKSAAIAGVLMGLMALSNTQAFFVGIILLGLAAIHMLYPKFKENGWKLDTLKAEKELLKVLAVLFLVGFAISLLFWFRPIFVFHGYTPNDIQNITYPDVTRLSVFIDMSYSLLKELLLPFGLGSPGIALSALNVAGIYFMAKDPGKYGIVLVVFVAAVIGILHPAITEPLLNTQLMSTMMYGRVATLSAALLVAVGLVNLLGMLKDGKVQVAVMASCILLAGMAVGDIIASKGAGQWSIMAKAGPLPGYYAELGGWIKENTNVNDVFLTTNEDGFMMNALTGRKVVSYRRAHSSPYTDMHARMADQAVMVYGTNAAKTKELLDKYGVKYLLVTYNWVSNEFRVSEEGELLGFFDPLDVPDNPTNRAYWDANGVSYISVTMSMDPAPPTNVPLYDLIVALPYMEGGGPISPVLMQEFRPVKAVQVGGQNIFLIYERK